MNVNGRKYSISKLVVDSAVDSFRVLIITSIWFSRKVT